MLFKATDILVGRIKIAIHVEKIMENTSMIVIFSLQFKYPVVECNGCE